MIQGQKLIQDTFVRTEQWEHLDQLSQPSAEKQLRLVGVDGVALSLHDTVCTHLKLGGKAFPSVVTVVDNITADVILGMDDGKIARLMLVGRPLPFNLSIVLELHMQ